MALRYVEYKRRQWVLRFRDPWSGKQRVRSFFAEAEAKAFEAIQAELYARERELIRRARRRTSSASATRATVAELLGRYMETLENPTTRSTTAQHIEPLTAIFGHRRAHCLTCDDVLAWCEVQRQRGVGQSTVHRRVSILRTAYSWAVRMRVLTGNPLMALRIAKPATRRITPPSTKEARLLYEVAAPHIRRVIVLGMATGARIGPSELFRLKWSDVDIETGIIRMPNAHKGALDEARAVANTLSLTKDGPSVRFRAAGITPSSGPVSRGASGPTICGTPSPLLRSCMALTSKASRKQWDTGESQCSSLFTSTRGLTSAAGQ